MRAGGNCRRATWARLQPTHAAPMDRYALTALRWSLLCAVADARTVALNSSKVKPAIVTRRLLPAGARPRASLWSRQCGRPQNTEALRGHSHAAPLRLSASATYCGASRLLAEPDFTPELAHYDFAQQRPPHSSSFAPSRAHASRRCSRGRAQRVRRAAASSSRLRHVGRAGWAAVRLAPSQCLLRMTLPVVRMAMRSSKTTRTGARAASPLQSVARCQRDPRRATWPWLSPYARSERALS
jgi:hypothetical protein